MISPMQLLIFTISEIGDNMNNYVMEYYNLDGEVAQDKFTASSEEVFIGLFDREDNEDY